MKHPLLMGIINRTPDSFSGDGSLSVAETLANIDAMLAAGADILDLGAESTRPGAPAIGDAEEWARLEPVLLALQQHPKRQTFRLSLDSFRPATVEKAIGYGIDIANDVSGLRADAMLPLLSQWHGDIVVMHALTVPVDPAVTWGAGVDPVAEILRWKQEVLARAMAAGIAPTRLIFDPGIGFGKTAVQSLHLIAHAHALVVSGGRWLVGHSRKSFMKSLAADVAERDASTLAMSALLAQSGVHVLRVHDVARHRAMLDALCM